MEAINRLEYFTQTWVFHFVERQFDDRAGYKGRFGQQEFHQFEFMSSRRTRFDFDFRRRIRLRLRCWQPI